MKITGTDYKSDGSCVLNCLVEEAERDFLMEYGLTRLIEKMIEELSNGNSKVQ